MDALQFYNGYGFKTARGIDTILTSFLLKSALNFVVPFFCSVPHSQSDNCPSSNCKPFLIVWPARLLVRRLDEESQAKIEMVLNTAGFSDGNIGTLTSAAEFSASV